MCVCVCAVCVCERLSAISRNARSHGSATGVAHERRQQQHHHHIKHNKSRRDTGCRKEADKKASRERITRKRTTRYSVYIHICTTTTIYRCPFVLVGTPYISVKWSTRCEHHTPRANVAHVAKLFIIQYRMYSTII